MASFPRKRFPSWLVGIFLLAAFVLGYWLHHSFEGHLSPSGLRAWVQSWGTLAPVLYVVIVTFRQFLLLPSMLVVAVGGVCFGVLWGTTLGALGLFLSGVITFALGRGLGGERVRQWFQNKYPDWEARVETLGPWVVFATMVYPGGPMTGVFWASGLATVPFLPFALAVATGGVVRAFTYSFFGASLVDGITPRFIVVAVGLAAVFILPLCFPSVRRQLGKWRG